MHLSHGDPLAVHGLDIAVRLAEQGRLRVPVAAAFPLATPAAAHELSATRHSPGKIVLVTNYPLWTTAARRGPR